MRACAGKYSVCLSWGQSGAASDHLVAILTKIFPLSDEFDPVVFSLNGQSHYAGWSDDAELVHVYGPLGGSDVTAFQCKQRKVFLLPGVYNITLTFDAEVTEGNELIADAVLLKGLCM